MAHRTRLLILAITATGALQGSGASAQRSAAHVPEVRQLVTFRFSTNVGYRPRPSMDALLDLYRAASAVLRLRGFNEAESAEPFDVILMTSFRGLEGFDQAQRQLGIQRTRDGVSVETAYRNLDRMSEWHRDHFIEMLDRIDHRSSTPPELYIFEWVRVTPGAHRAYELLLESAVFPWERDLDMLRVTETGRIIIGDDWDYVRLLGFSTMGGYHDYLQRWREHGASEQVAAYVAAHKTYVVTEDEHLRVR